MVPEADANRVRAWADSRGAGVRDELRIEVDETPRDLTIFECHPPWNPRLGGEWSRIPVARLGYARTTGEWTLRAFDRNGRAKRYDRCPPTADVRTLLAEIDDDPTCIFWG